MGAAGRWQLRIGLDARHLTHPQEGGFKSYTKSLVAAIAKVDRRNEYFIYTDRSSDTMMEFPDNFRVKIVQGGLPVREQIAMPIALARDHVEVAHFLSNTAPLLVRCPYVLTVHDVIPCLPEAAPRAGVSRKARLLDRYWREVIPLAAGRAASIITVSEFSSSDIQRVLGTSQERIQVLHNGIDSAFRTMEPESYQAVLKDYNLPSGRFILGFLSKEPRKNSAGIVSAFRLMADKVPDCGLVLVSSSRDDSGVLAEAVLRDTRITILRRLPQEALVALYNAATALVFPSFSEGFGLPVLEAMACGTPVISSNIGALSEVAGDAALLVDPANIDGMAKAILAVLSTESLRQSLRTKGFERAEMFSWEETAKRLIVTYAKAAGAGNPEEVRPFSGSVGGDPTPEASTISPEAAK
jgi:glycosyltransferase involved in cell wall biosynthesis